MSPSWSIYVTVLTLINLVGLVWLLIATARRRKDEHSNDKTTGHVWDGDISELNNPLPRWWLGMFILSFVFGAAYLVIYPGLGNWAGTSGWTSGNELRASIDAANAKLESVYAQFRNRPLDELARDPAAQKLGHNVFVNNCAACHGSDARGAKGFPSLVDRDWLWGGESEAILASVRDGRQGAMPALGATLPNGGVSEVANYVRSLSGLPHNEMQAKAGLAKFAGICAACHGVDGHGNVALGAPNLSDEIWLYGSSQATIEETIMNGRGGRMPAWSSILGDDRTRLVTAWILAQSKDPAPAVPSSGAP
ncbi:MAG: cytochrome-c oxidase, cbb3-type subunit III [Tahibacter sp.]